MRPDLVIYLLADISAAVRLELSVFVSSSLHSFACSYRLAQTLSLHAAVSSTMSANVLQVCRRRALSRGLGCRCL